MLKFFTSQRNPAFFIAEIGGNHEGDFDYALRLCDQAIDSGADAVKFQLYRGDRLISSVSNPSGNARLKTFELSREQHIAIAERVRAAGCHYMASVWDEEMLSWVNPYIEIHKVGSGDLTCVPMLHALAATGKPIILSTGASNLDEVSAAIDFIAGVDGRYLAERKLALLQCTSAYPTSDEAANLRVVLTLAERFKLPVGYSDHTVGSDALELAYSLGARILEKHFTDDREGKTFRDHEISLTRDEVKTALDRLRRTERLLGSSQKSLTDAEERMGHPMLMRRGLHAATRIEKGQPLTTGNLVALRPRVGLCASLFYDVLGRFCVRTIEPFEPIAETDLEPIGNAEIIR